MSSSGSATSSRSGSHGCGGSAGSRLAALDIAIIAIGALLFLVLAVAFAHAQTIWLDETTQLSGIALPLKDQWAWLTGKFSLVPGLPGDRAPPLSYWLGTLWSGAFGLSETSLRYFGIALVLCTAPALYLIGRTIADRTGGAFVLGSVLLLGMVITESVEIRAYPLFFTLATWSEYFLVLLVMRDDAGQRTRRLVLMSLFLTATIYSHFFGVVTAGCIFAALLADALVKGRGLRSVVLAGCAVALLSAGLVPFLLSAISVSGGAGNGVDPTLFTKAVQSGNSGGAWLDVLKRAGRLVGRLLVHPSEMGIPTVFIAYLAAIALLIGGVGASMRWSASDGRNARAAGSTFTRFCLLALPVVLAISALSLLSLRLKAFDGLAPHYNVWMLPLVMALLSFAFGGFPDAGWGRVAVRATAAVAVSCTLMASVFLVRHGTLYSHGGAEWTMERIPEPGSTLVIHDGRGDWRHLYFSLHYLGKGRITQWVGDSASNLHRITPDGVPAVENPAAELSRYKTILEARTRNLSSGQLAEIVQGKTACAFDEASIPGIANVTGQADAASSYEPEHYCSYISVTLRARRLPPQR